MPFLSLVIICLFFLRTTPGPQTRLPKTDPPEVSPISIYDTLKREAAPEWKSISFDGYRLSIPYSSEWKNNEIGISVFDTDIVDPGVTLLRFGRPINTGTFFSREYTVHRDRWERADADFDSVILPRCIDDFTPLNIHLGTLSGFQYHYGGAKGCGLGFAFARQHHVYYIEHKYDMEEPPETLPQEMKTIIQSIQDK